MYVHVYEYMVLPTNQLGQITADERVRIIADSVMNTATLRERYCTQYYF